MKGIDIAQYTVVPEPWQWEAIDLAGYGDFVIIAVGDLNAAKRNAQIESALKAGKRPEGYIYDHAERAKEQTTEAIVNIQREGYDIPFLWHDIEETRGYAPSQIVAILQDCVFLAGSAGWSRAEGQGIYSGGWIWPTATANSNAFADMALWTAFYNSDNSGHFHEDWPIDFSNFSPYGGWRNLPRPNRRDTRQYRGTYDLAGVNVDLNWRDDRWRTEDDLATMQDIIRIVEGATPDERELLNAHLMNGKVPIYPLAPADHPTLGTVLHKAYYAKEGDDAVGRVSQDEIEEIVRETLEGARVTLPEESDE